MEDNDGYLIWNLTYNEDGKTQMEESSKCRRKKDELKSWGRGENDKEPEELITGE